MESSLLVHDIFISISEHQAKKIGILLNTHTPMNILQIGCGNGDSTYWIEKLYTHTHKHTVVDHEEKFIQSTKQLIKKHKLLLPQFIHSSSQIFLASRPRKNYYDFCLLDGDERFDGCLTDWFYLKDLINKEGIVVMRNIWNPSVRKVISFILKNYPFVLTETSSIDNIFLKIPWLHDFWLERLGRKKWLDLCVLKKIDEDKRNWNHYVRF